jgi:hypothetical protein
MTTSDLIASLGVTILLVGYFLSLFKIIHQESTTYGILNIAGAGLAGYASILIGFMPFVVLESAWVVVAIIGLMKKRTIAERQ